MAKYRKKPVVIEARQLTLKNAYELVVWVGGQLFDNPEEGGYNIVITTLEGEMTARVNDYIIQGVRGEFYPCKPDIFEQTYELINEDS